MASIDKAAIVFSIAITLVGVGIAAMGGSMDNSPAAPTQQMSSATNTDAAEKAADAAAAKAAERAAAADAAAAERAEAAAAKAAAADAAEKAAAADAAAAKAADAAAVKAAPETIEAAVHENNKNAAQKTPIIWSLRLTAIRALVGLARSFPPNPPPKNSPVLSVIIDGASPGPVGKAQYIHQPNKNQVTVTKGISIVFFIKVCWLCLYLDAPTSYIQKPT